MKYGFCKIGEYVTVLSGYAFKSEDFQAVGIPVIKIGNIKLGHVSLDDGNTECIPRAIADKLGRKFIVRKGDVLISLTGSHLTQPGSVVGRVGRYYYDSISVLNQRAGKIIVKDEEKSHLGFWFYLLSTKAVMTEIAMLAHGAANQANVSPKDIEKIWLPLPPLPIQKKIAAILSAYDELIENNNRRIALLEKMAEEIYREWFVRMRFPGHEKTKFHKGIPEGWEVKKLGEVAEITYGFPFDGKQFNNNGDGNRIVRIRNIQSGETGDFSPEKVEEKYRICNGDFLVGMDGEFHMNRWSGGDAFLVQRTCRIKAKNNLLEYYVGKTVEPQVKFFESILMGATVGHLGAKHLNEMTVVVPDHSLATGLQALNDFMKTVLRLKTQNTLLKQTRDALLPRLMSGKLDVENLDIAFPPGMQN